MRGPVTRPVVPAALSKKASVAGIRAVAVVERRLSPAPLPVPVAERFSVDWEMPASPAADR